MFEEHIIISLSEDQSIFKKEPLKIKEVLFNKDSDTRFDTFWHYEDTGFYIRIDYSHVAKAYICEICYSEDRIRWGVNIIYVAAHSDLKRYKTPQECIPDIEHHVLILS